MGTLPNGAKVVIFFSTLNAKRSWCLPICRQEDSQEKVVLDKIQIKRHHYEAEVVFSADVTT